MKPVLSSLRKFSWAQRPIFSAAILAGGMALATHASAVVVTTFANTSVPVPANIDGVYLNFVTGATGTASFTGWDVNMYLTNSVFTFFWNNTAPSVSGGVGTAVTGGTYLSLNPGDTVSASSVFTASSGGGGAGSTINFQTAGTHILGFRFYNESTAAINYGYATIQNGATAGFPATITGWVYENSGASITVVPEPASAMMFAAGALALGAAGLRRKRRQAAA